MFTFALTSINRRQRYWQPKKLFDRLLAVAVWHRIHVQLWGRISVFPRYQTAQSITPPRLQIYRMLILDRRDLPSSLVWSRRVRRKGTAQRDSPVCIIQILASYREQG